MRRLVLTALAASLTLAGGVAFGADIKLALKKQLNLPRIIGGVATLAGERPWMASLQMDGEHFCGASVIDRSWILTAAHCVEDLSPADVRSLSVRVNFTDLESGQGEEHAVARVFSHPQYAQDASNDVALLRLERSVSDDVPLLPMATPSVMQSSGRAGQMASVSGWGNTSINGENYPRNLRNVHVPIVSNAVCNSPEAYDGEVEATELCAGYSAGGKDSCQGDSGGPLVVPHEGDFHQIGVVSWGEGCALPNKYGVYARVTAFTQWITEVQASQGDGTAVAPSKGSLQSGVLVAGLRGETDAEQRFTLTVPPGARLLWIDIKGGSGDADVYVRRTNQPTTDSYQFAPFQDGNNEQVLIRNPKAGTWHVLIHAYDAFKGVELMGFTR